jgi:hypothetical protein
MPCSLVCLTAMCVCLSCVTQGQAEIDIKLCRRFPATRPQRGQETPVQPPLCARCIHRSSMQQPPGNLTFAGAALSFLRARTSVVLYLLLPSSQTMVASQQSSGCRFAARFLSGVARRSRRVLSHCPAVLPAFVAKARLRAPAARRPPRGDCRELLRGAARSRARLCRASNRPCWKTGVLAPSIPVCLISPACHLEVHARAVIDGAIHSASVIWEQDSDAGMFESVSTAQASPLKTGSCSDPPPTKSTHLVYPFGRSCQPAGRPPCLFEPSCSRVSSKRAQAPGALKAEISGNLCVLRCAIMLGCVR